MKKRLKINMYNLILAALLMQLTAAAHTSFAGQIPGHDREDHGEQKGYISAEAEAEGDDEELIFGEGVYKKPPEGFQLLKWFYEYDGLGHAAEISCTEQELVDAGYEVTYCRMMGNLESDYTTELPVRAGKYRVRIRTKRTEHYYPYTFTYDDWIIVIGKKTVSITGLSSADKDYDGTVSADIIGTPVLEGKLEGDELTVIFGKAAFEDAAAGVDKTVRFSGFRIVGEDGDNYTLSSQPGSVTADIRPGDISGSRVFLTAGAFEYDGTEKYVRVEKVVTTGGRTLDPEADYSVSGNLSGIKKGSYTVTVKGLENYCGTVSANWSIEDEAVKVRAVNVNAIYDGTPHGVRVDVTEPVSANSIRYGITEGVYDLSESPAITDAGELTVYYRASAPGYRDRMGAVIIRVSPRPVTVRADDQSKYAGHADPEFTATVTGLLDGASQNSIDYYLSRIAGEEPGTYSIIPAGKPLQGNYSVNYENGALTISLRKNSGSTVREPVSQTAGTAQAGGIKKITLKGDLAVKQKVDASAYMGAYRRYVVSPKGAARVDKKKRLITVRKPGSITITAYDREGREWKAKEEISLSARIAGVRKKVLVLTAGGETVSGETNLVDGTLSPDRWESSNPGVAAVDEKTGTIIPGARGRAFITAYYGSGALAARVRYRVVVR